MNSLKRQKKGTKIVKETLTSIDITNLTIEYIKNTGGRGTLNFKNGKITGMFINFD